MPSPDPMSAYGDDILLEAHERRLRDLEMAFNGLNTAVLPALARLEQSVSHGFEAVNDRLDRGELRFERIEQGLGEVKEAASEDTARDLARDSKIVDLEKAETARKERWKAALKWVGTVAAPLVVIALAILLGLK